MDNQKNADEKIKHIVRIAGTDLEGNKSVHYAITGIKGIGRRTARIIAQNAGLDLKATMGYLSDEEIERLKKAVEDFEKNSPRWMINRQKDPILGIGRHITSSDILLTLQEDINRMKKTRSYTGIRHERGHKVRGQRTRSTGRKGAIVGVVRKKLIAAKGEKK
ncbi:MAG: 30S ribosomal protein S13 [Methanocellales archaeon]|nr:30S ribosomal protein S13 [Methanocellales archaeon]